MQPIYGITLEMNAQNFLDVYFGEIATLTKDVKNAPDIKYKLLYIIMAPGWSHTSQHKTASVVRAAFLKQQISDDE